MIYYLTINSDYRIKDPNTGIAQVQPSYVRDGMIQDGQTKMIFRTGVVTKVNTEKFGDNKLPPSLQKMVNKGILKIVKREKLEDDKSTIPVNSQSDVVIEDNSSSDDKFVENTNDDQDNSEYVPEKIDYSQMTKQGLKNELDKRGIGYKDNALKEELIEMLVQDDSK